MTGIREQLRDIFQSWLILKKSDGICIRPSDFCGILKPRYHCGVEHVAFLKDNRILESYRVNRAELQGSRRSVFSFRALKRRDGEKGKKSSGHCAGVDVGATGCDWLSDRSLSHTRRHWEKQPITHIKCQADKRESTGRVKTCGFIYGHRTDFLTLSAGGKKNPPFFAEGDYVAG